jgi:hypothetical protein
VADVRITELTDTIETLKRTIIDSCGGEGCSSEELRLQVVGACRNEEKEKCKRPLTEQAKKYPRQFGLQQTCQRDQRQRHKDYRTGSDTIETLKQTKEVTQSEVIYQEKILTLWSTH